MRWETRFIKCSPISVDINASITNRSNWSNQIKQRRRLSPAVAAEKVDILTELNAGKKQVDIYRERDIAPSTVATILKGQEKVVRLHRESQLAPSRKRLRLGNYQTVDDARLLIKIRLKLPTEVNIRQAAEILTGSWWNAKASTISNCWRKAGLLETSITPQDCEPTPRDCDDEAELDPEFSNEPTKKLPVDAAVTFEDYVDRDCAAATSAELTCEEIVSQVHEQDCCSTDEDDAGDAESGTTEETISSSDVVVFLEKTRS
ncbi:hypothetical protein HPB52_019429 [Rhipicephalus sanguineus]|uniref:Uncharacterized protein n=1 Tax=Rhipicephalus sanguineus TaxID=34632 RepID=A0A9D4Q821_RHISA|nr:hypothetical protein HPB52_019429 [Rhipicephalus sanguineus]